MASVRSGSGVKPKWPGRESHLSTESESEVKLTVDSKAPLESSNRKSLGGAQAQSQQVAPPTSRSKTEITFENWNPMEQDYNDTSFNSYNRGSAAGISGTNASRPDKRSGKLTLFVGNLPTEMTEEGLSNLFGHVCDTVHVKVCQPRDRNSDTTFGFVDVPSIKDGEEAIKRLDGHTIRHRRIKVAFKREKVTKPVEASSCDSPEEWDPPSNAPKRIGKTPPTKQSTPSTKRQSSGSGRTSTGSSEAEEDRTKAKRQTAQPRRMEDRYGTSLKPKSFKEASVIKSSTGPGGGQTKSPPRADETQANRADSTPPPSPLQALLQKMRGTGKSSPEAGQGKDKTQQAGILSDGQTVTSPGFKSLAGGTGQAGRSRGREADSDSAQEDAPVKSVTPATAEKHHQAGTTSQKGERLGSSPSVADQSVKIEQVTNCNSAPTKTAPQPLLSLSHEPIEGQTDRVGGKETRVHEIGQSDNLSRSQGPKRNKQDGILGAAPQSLLPQPHSLALSSSQNFCFEGGAHERHEANRHGLLGHHPHHHHGPVPKNGPFTRADFSPTYRDDGLAEGGSYPLCHHQSKPHRQMQHSHYALGPNFPQEPPYRPAHPYASHSQYGRSPLHPLTGYSVQHGHYSGRGMYQMGYPQPSLGSAGFRSGRLQNNRPKSSPRSSAAPPKALPNPDGEASHSSKTQQPKSPSDKSPAGKRKTQNEEEPKAKTVGEGPVAGNQGRDTKRTSLNETAPVPAQKSPKSGLQTPEGQPTAVDKTPTSKSLASAEGQRSLHKSPQGSEDPKPCVLCGKTSLLRCSKCKSSYCSRECQKEHWPTHKHECQKVASAQGLTAASSASSKDPSPAKPQSTTLPRKTTEVLHGGIEGLFMARNLPYEIPEKPEMRVLVTEVYSPGELWVQLVQERSIGGFADLVELLDSVYTDPSQAEQLTCTAKVGGICAARYSQDAQWYRGEVVSINGAVCTVCLIDYGTVDEVPVDGLRRLQDAMLKLPKQALKCHLSGVKPPGGSWSTEATETLKSMINKEENCTRAEFKGRVSEGQEIELYSPEDPTKTLSSILISAGLAEATSTAGSCQPTRSLPTVSPGPSLASLGSALDGISAGQQLEVMVSHVDNLSCFYANLFNSAQALLELHHRLNAHYAKMPPRAGFRPGVGMLCAAKYSMDGNWYRAVRDEKSGPVPNRTSLPITFIDHGNSETVSLDDCRPLEAQFTMLPRQALLCSLAGVKPDKSDWPEEMIAAFKEWLMDGYTRIEIRAKSGSRLNVEIFSLQSGAGQDIQDISFNALLRHSGFGAVDEVGAAEQVSTNSADRTPTNEMATPAEEAVAGKKSRGLPVVEPPHSEFHGFVTVVNDPNNFYLQVDSEENREIFLTFTEHLNTRYTLQDLAPHKPSVGEYCAVIYSDDAWYRALVVDQVVPGPAFKVLLVDYGEDAVLPLDRIRQLEERFYDQPAVALHCSLTCTAAPSCDRKWTEAAIKHFKEKVLNQLCQVNIATFENGKCEVELLYPGRGMNELTSIKRDLIQKGWAVCKGTPSSNEAHALGSGDHQVSNHSAASRGSPKVDSSSSMLPANHGVSHSPSVSQSVPSLPAPQVPTEDFLGLVTVVSDMGDVYVQVATDENACAVQSLVLNLNQHYALAPLRPHRPGIGECCASKYKMDNLWYRGRVLGGGSSQDTPLEIFFVDYGNTETVSPEDVQKLEEKFKHIPVAAIHCRLSGLRAPSRDDAWNSDLRKEILEKAFKVHVTKYDGKVCEVELLYSNDDSNWCSLNKELIVKGLAEPVAMENHSPGPSGDHQSANQEQQRKTQPALSANKNEQSLSQLPVFDRVILPTTCGVPETLANEEMELKSGDRVEAGLAKLPDGIPPPAEFTAILTCVSSPCDFHLQIKSNDYIQLSRLLRTELNRHYPRAGERPHLPRAGDLCAAMYSADGEWYRALALMEVAPEQAFKVMFVDYGNWEVVPVERLQKLEGDFLEVPRLAHRCSLSGVMAPSGDKEARQFAEAACYISTELIEKDKDCQVKLVKHDGKVYEVELQYSSDDGSEIHNLKDELIRLGLARPMTMATTPNKEGRLLARTLQKAILPTNTQVAVTVTHVVNPHEFYCQLIIREEIDKLKFLMEQIAQEAVSLQLRGPPMVGDLCLAKYTDDYWYRAEVLKINQAKERALVYYVDFGNEEPLPWSQLVTPEGQFAELPMQAIRCGLQGLPRDIAVNEQTVCDLIRERTDAKRMLAKMSGTTDDGTSLISLIDEDGTDIGQLVKDHLSGAASPAAPKSPLPDLPVSPSGSVASPGTAASDPAKLDALKREIELKKRELAEMERIRASLEQAL
ncbi:uncharacterized protein LOC110977121 isoform X2 [Acanthaster planci]|uniref:Uncharacterized protein LOC110977121 isoform X2 n=1 Tax=Acanthaster planci TaxID=133434 RepID=A0A8B7Y2W4_ACAPL|nr:uncharacterized protein LOC110977121 isoform X2 [Acanthaster planci]